MENILTLIKDAEEKITRLQTNLFKFYNKSIHIKPGSLYKADSSIYTIEDCLYSFSEFIEKTGKHHNLYLNAYGILNMLYTQSDAIHSLYSSIGIKYQHNDDIQRIRDLRSLSVGHPTNTFSENRKCTSIISRATMKNESFAFLVYFENGETKLIECNLVELISEQLLHLNKLTDKLLSHINNKTVKTLSPLPNNFFNTKFNELGIPDDIDDIIYKSTHSTSQIKKVILNLNKFKVILKDNHFLSESSEHTVNTLSDLLNAYDKNGKKSSKVKIFEVSSYLNG